MYNETICNVIYCEFLFLILGNGLIDETEFLQWVARIQALREEPVDQVADQEDEINQDLMAAFRLVFI